mmetsp:Transcript_9161/g.21723  ORF Transcript_9161/g.21723 Transcript_9161/m.21723 type:complete len:408 (-) Transcript_9161:60-1283(-)
MAPAGHVAKGTRSSGHSLRRRRGILHILAQRRQIFLRPRIAIMIPDTVDEERPGLLQESCPGGLPIRRWPEQRHFPQLAEDCARGHHSCRRPGEGPHLGQVPDVELQHGLSCLRQRRLRLVGHNHGTQIQRLRRGKLRQAAAAGQQLLGACEAVDVQGRGHATRGCKPGQDFAPSPHRGCIGDGQQQLPGDAPDVELEGAGFRLHLDRIHGRALLLGGNCFGCIGPEQQRAHPPGDARRRHRCRLEHAQLALRVVAQRPHDGRHGGGDCALVEVYHAAEESGVGEQLTLRSLPEALSPLSGGHVKHYAQSLASEEDAWRRAVHLPEIAHVSLGQPGQGIHGVLPRGEGCRELQAVRGCGALRLHLLLCQRRADFQVLACLLCFAHVRELLLQAVRGHGARVALLHCG